MDGILLVKKPSGITSFAVVSRIKKIFLTKKVGHCGTLDPFATGLLIVAINSATKIVQFIEAQEKTYIAKLKLGEKTDTGDLMGTIIENKSFKNYSVSEIKSVFQSFIGESYQIPPMYSAIKINGEKLYNLARKGIEIDRKKRKIEIYNLELIDKDEESIKFLVKCSKGTYIRTLGEDIANKLNTCGHLVELERTKIGEFDLKNALVLDSINKDSKMTSIYEALSSMPKYFLKKEEEKKAINGQSLNIESEFAKLLLVDCKDNPIAIYYKDNGNEYRCLRGLQVSHENS
ncbi:MAG: tRNA pseudouridine(55) synthase TruB [Bacilli bacterium]|nr:tRNA pseudouridine(55) synthase TruB [Bacilli bacterium]